MIYLDTHVLIWLYEGNLQEFSPAALTVLEKEDWTISPMVLLELKLLEEIGRLNHDPLLIVETMSAQSGLQVSRAGFEQVVLGAIQLEWTRDPFDRVIVGQAEADNSLLVTRDRMIRANCSLAVWD